MADRDKTRVQLSGVPETLLWTLYYRATEAARPDSVLPDPVAVDLLTRIDFPFRERFGAARANPSQVEGLRSRRFDAEVRAFLAEHPDGTVVALGEGLETQFWRVDNGRVRWLTVDLPQTIDVRRKVLPCGPRQRLLACSALDERWLDEVDPGKGVLITAQGLLMYFQEHEVHQLIAACADRLPGGVMLFDAIPKWINLPGVNAAMQTSSGYRCPARPWSVNAGAPQGFRALHPNIVDVHDLWITRGRGFVFGLLAHRANRIPVVRRYLPSMLSLRFGMTVAAEKIPA